MSVCMNYITEIQFLLHKIYHKHISCYINTLCKIIHINRILSIIYHHWNREYTHVMAYAVLHISKKLLRQNSIININKYITFKLWKAHVNLNLCKILRSCSGNGFHGFWIPSKKLSWKGQVRLMWIISLAFHKPSSSLPQTG